MQISTKQGKESSMFPLKWITCLAVLCSATLAELPSASGALNIANLRGGFSVVVGTENGELEAGLTDNGTCLVQGLALTRDAALQARKYLYQQKLYPLASVTYVESANRLPYTDKLVNFLVADLEALGNKAPSIEEINRVLGYNATAYIKENGSWRQHKKPMPPNVNEFTHWKDDSALTSFQDDHVVNEPPNQVRWIGAPDAYFKNQNRHGLSLFESERVGGGTYTGSMGGGTWARDAFSGVLLWRNDYLDYKYPSVSHQGSAQQWALNSKYLFGYTGRDGEGLVAYDLRTGQIKHHYSNTKLLKNNTDEKDASNWDKQVLTVAHTMVHGNNLIQIFGNKVWYLDQETGEIIWQYQIENSDSATIIRNGLVQDTVLALAVTQLVWGKQGHAVYKAAREYFADFKQVVGVRVSDGKLLWTLDELPNGQTLFHEMVGGGHGKAMLVYTNREDFHSLNLHTGQIEWSTDDAEGYGVGSYRGNAIAVPDEELVVFGSHQAFSTHILGSGNKVGSMSCGQYFGSCPSLTMTPNFVIMSDKWIPRSDIKTMKAADNFDMVTIGASACNYFPIVAYGSIYQLGGKCSCRRTIPSQSCSQRVTPVEFLSDAQRRMADNGSASLITEMIEQQAMAKNSQIGDEWTERCLGTYLSRADVTCENPDGGLGRNGQVMVSGELLYHWNRLPAWTGYARQETPAVSAGDLSIVSVVHEHRITAKRNGQVVWNFIADSRVTGTPVVDESRVYFGSHDGYVYALNLSDGSPAWKFMAAPNDLRIVAYGQVESAWPVFGVALRDGKLYTSAGRLATLDGGIQAYCLNADDGSMVWNVSNQSGFVDETVVHNGADNIKSKGCEDDNEMSDIRGWIIDNAINDEPFLENGMLSIPDWHIDINNPRDTVFFEGNIPTTPVGTIQRSGGSVVNNHRISPMISIRNGALWVLGMQNKTYRVGINDARGRNIASVTQQGVLKTDLALDRLPNGFYVVWVQIDGQREYARLKLTSIR